MDEGPGDWWAADVGSICVSRLFLFISVQRDHLLQEELDWKIIFF